MPSKKYAKHSFVTFERCALPRGLLYFMSSLVLFVFHNSKAHYAVLNSNYFAFDSGSSVVIIA